MTNTEPAFKMPQRLSFSTIMPMHQIAWDSTSLGALKNCPRYYYYNIGMGYTTKAENVHLVWGSAYNNSLVTYNKSRATGKDHKTSVIDAVRYALTTTWDEKLNVPWTSDEPTKNRETLVRAVIWYLDRFENDPLETLVLADGTPAVEQPFRISLDRVSSLTGEHYMLCGYLDREVKFNGGDWVTDWKSSKYALDEKYFAKYSPNNQVSQYSVAGRIMNHREIKGVIIDAVQLGVTFARFQRREIPRTQAQLEEWLHDATFYIRQNEAFVEANYWPQNDTACDKYGGCPFRAICGASPEVRPKLLDGLFHRRSWDPLLVREI
jgi:hypothetical protein